MREGNRDTYVKNDAGYQAIIFRILKWYSVNMFVWIRRTSLFSVKNFKVDSVQGVVKLKYP
jgi:hypothetical protein